MRGIDYGNGLTNSDLETGIRYGVISPHTPMAEALDDIYTNGEDLSYASAVLEAKRQIANALKPTLDELGVLPYVPKYAKPTNDQNAKQNEAIDSIVESVWSEIEQDFNDQYTCDDAQYRYEADGYIIETTSLGLYVIKSPFYTLCEFCSPCCPGAGNLDSHSDDGVKTYCLGSDWFENGVTPYPVFEVPTNA